MKALLLTLLLSCSTTAATADPLYIDEEEYVEEHGEEYRDEYYDYEEEEFDPCPT